MKQRHVTIVLTGGGSGGHITPLLSLAHELKKTEPSARLVYIGWRGDKQASLRAQFKIFDDVLFVPAGKYRRYHNQRLWARLLDIKTLALNIVDFFKAIVGTVVAYRLLGKIKPDLVFSKGSFVAVPVGVAARLRKIPLITHDSDVVPGLANRIIGRWAVMHATGQPVKYYDYPKERTRYTGIPVDPRISHVSEKQQRRYKQALGLPARADLLLIAGGGLGAASINQKLTAIVPRLFGYYPNLHIIHLTGTNHETKVREDYEIDPVDAGRLTVTGFSGEFYALVGAADLIISRAGATALAEYAIAGKATILVPAEHLTGGHQLANTKRLTENGAVAVVSDKASADELYQIISTLLDDPSQRSKLASNLAALAQPQAAKKLAKLIFEVAGAKAK